jgi:uncharacterized integral membrane protein (TIGR00698 family)
MTEISEPALALKPSRAARLWTYACEVFPGVAIAGFVAMSAKLVTEHHGGSAILLALLMGMAVGFLREIPLLRAGLAFSSRPILRFGVALLGAQITLQFLAGLGWPALVFIAIGVALTTAAGALIARLFGQTVWFGVLAGGAVGICGAAAAAAIAAVLPRHEKSNADTAMTIIGVTALSTVAMIAYPLLGHALGMDDRTIGFFLGLTIHDVAQVVGAGYSVSEETGDLAVVVKLFRVVLLLPVVLIVVLTVKATAQRAGSARPGVPLFVVGFALLVVARSFGFIPADVAPHLADLSRWCLVTAMAAIGIHTALGEIRALGYKPALLLTGLTVAIAAFGWAGTLVPGVLGR